jgi:hypothetical protein
MSFSKVIFLIRIKTNAEKYLVCMETGLPANTLNFPLADKESENMNLTHHICSITSPTLI